MNTSQARRLVISGIIIASLLCTALIVSGYDLSWVLLATTSP